MINCSHSQWLPVSSGVPQGSVLGPLLFLLYINDIQEVIQHSSVKVFADDVALYKEVLSLSDCIPLQGHVFICGLFTGSLSFI